MTKIEQLDQTEHWSTTAKVDGKVETNQNGRTPDFEPSIDSATDSVQSWVMEVIGEVDVSKLPDITADANSLLVTATTLLAASEYHETKAQQVSSGDGTPGHVFLESRAKDKFEEWKGRYQLRQENEDRQSDTRSGNTGGNRGRTSSLVDVSSSDRRRSHRSVRGSRRYR